MAAETKREGETTFDAVALRNLSDEELALRLKEHTSKDWGEVA